MNSNNNDWLKQLLMMGVGTTSLVAEKIKEASEQLVKDGKLDAEGAKAFADNLMNQFNSDPQNFQKNMEKQMKTVLQDLGVPRQAEMDELRGRIDRLERQIRNLENRSWQ